MDDLDALGRLYFAMGNNGKALQQYQTGLAPLMEEFDCGNHRRCKSPATFGNTLRIQYFQRQASLYEDIAEIRISQKHYAEAITNLSKALSIYQREGLQNRPPPSPGSGSDSSSFRGVVEMPMRMASGMPYSQGDRVEDDARLTDPMLVPHSDTTFEYTDQPEFVDIVGQIRTLGQIARLYDILGNPTKAVQQLSEAITLAQSERDRVAQAQLLADQSLAYAHLGQMALAAQASRSAAHIASTLPYQGGLWRIIHAVAVSEVASGKRGPALKDFKRAVQLIESERADLSTIASRKNFQESAASVYDDYIAYLLSLNSHFPQSSYGREAFDVLQRKAGRALLEEVGSSEARTFKGVDGRIVAGEDAAAASVLAAQKHLTNVLSTPQSDTSQVAGARSALDRASAQLAALESRIRATPQLRAYYELRHPQPITARALQRLLGPGDVVLSYVILEKQSALWVIDRAGTKLISIAGRKPLGAALGRVLNNVYAVQNCANGTVGDCDLAQTSAASLPAFNHVSQGLYHLLLPPGAIPKGTRHLIIAPDAELYGLPWEALVTQSQPTPAYLIQQYAISYVPSASLLPLIRSAHRNAARKPLLAFARPTPGQYVISARQTFVPDVQAEAMAVGLDRKATRSGLAYLFGALPGTYTEAEAVRIALGAPKKDLYTDNDASRRRVLNMNRTAQLQNYRYILFATHAILPGAINGLSQPAIVLAHPEGGDAFLTMADIFTLSLRADFVALSACDTGAGARTSGEGVSGLTRAFLYAGTPAISVTLWEVYDKAAPLISPEVFARMKNGSSPAAALQIAKIDFLRRYPQYRHPFFWAPSVIFGN